MTLSKVAVNLIFPPNPLFLGASKHFLPQGKNRRKSTYESAINARKHIT